METQFEVQKEEDNWKGSVCVMYDTKLLCRQESLGDSSFGTRPCSRSTGGPQRARRLTASVSGPRVLGSWPGGSSSREPDKLHAQQGAIGGGLVV